MMFFDTSAFIALTIPTDSFHARALDLQKRLKDIHLFTSNAVVLESLGWIRFRGGRQVAVNTGHLLIGNDGISIERVTADDEREAWKLFQKTEGRGVSMIDCTTVVVMKRLKIKEIFSFDQDFKKFGLSVVPKL